jgi:galactonate dehydratase
MKKIAAQAEAHHLMMAPHSGSLGPVAEYAALHVLAALKHHFVDRDNVLHRMIPLIRRRP